MNKPATAGDVAFFGFLVMSMQAETPLVAWFCAGMSIFLLARMYWTRA